MSLISTIVLSLGPGFMLGLIALGLVTVYRGTGVLNLAHGAQVSLGGYIYWWLGVGVGFPLWIAFLGAVAGSAVSGALIQTAIMRPLRGTSPLTLLIGSIGALIVVQSVLLLLFGSGGKNVPSMLPTDRIGGPGFEVGADRLILIGIGITVAGALWAVYRFTPFGVVTSAAAENPVAAAALGHSADRLALGNWTVGGALAGGAGALLAPIAGLDLVTMTGLIVPALGAALAGGFISFPLTVAGAVVIQAMQAVMTSTVDMRGIGVVSTFVVVVALMLIRGKSIPDRGYLGTRMPTLGTGRLSAPTIVGWFVAAMVLVWAVRSFEWNEALLSSMLIAIVLLSIVVVTGYAGQLSLAQFALAGTGAVIATELSARTGLPFVPVLLIASIATVPVGLLLALAAIRMRGASLAVITLAFNVLLFATVFSRAELVTVNSPEIFGMDVGSATQPERYVTLVVIVFVLLALAVSLLRRSATGRRLIAVRGNERAAASIGVRVGATKVVAFGIASFIAAVGGVLFAFRGTAISYANFAPFASVDQLGWAVIGGVGFLAGPLLGMVFTPGGLGTQVADVIYSDQFVLLPLIGGVLLIITVIANPDGLASVLERGVRAVRRRRAHRRRSATVRSADLVESRASGSPRRAVGLDVSGVSVSFGAVEVLKNVSLSVAPGTVHGVIGPNGAGKTTLFDVISGFVAARHGEIRIGSTRIDGLPVWRRARRGLGRSFQSLELFPDLTVYDNLRAASESRRPRSVLRDLAWPRASKLSAAAGEAITLLGLEEDLFASADSLSYGKQRLVAIARAMASDADVILLDEPAAGLDEMETRELGAVVRAMASEYGKTVLLIEHDVEMIMTVSDAVTALHFGEVIATGAPAEVREHPAVVAAYLGVTEDAGSVGRTTVVPEETL